MITMKRLFVGALLCMSAALCLVACGSTDQGTVTGLFEVSGGPAGTPNRPLPGSVTLVSMVGHTYRIHVSANGKFTASVLADTYKVTGQSPYVHSAGNVEMICYANSEAVVKVHSVVNADVTCQIR
jgi:hypothetical protein